MIDGAGHITVTAADADAVPETAVTVAAPIAAAVTSPLELTEATLDAELLQATGALDIA